VDLFPKRNTDFSPILKSLFKRARLRIKRYTTAGRGSDYLSCQCPNDVNLGSLKRRGVIRPWPGMYSRSTISTQRPTLEDLRLPNIFKLCLRPSRSEPRPSESEEYNNVYQDLMSARTCDIVILVLFFFQRRKS